MNRTIRLLSFTFLALLALALPAIAQERIGVKQLTRGEATAVLENFRAYRFPADTCMIFEIMHKPRKSDDETVYRGTMWGKYLESGAAIRIRLNKKDAPPEEEKELLILSGKNPALWQLNASGVPEKVNAESTTPFFPGLIFTPFDLQTPFLFWEKYEYERTRRHRARPVHFFKMFPPDSFLENNPEISHVSIGFDRTYNALVSAELYNKDGKKQKSFSLGKVQKVQEIYTFKELQLRDDITRDRDTLIVRAAAMHLRLPEGFFRPENLSKSNISIPAEAFQILE